MIGASRHFYRFGSFRLDVGERQLLLDDAPIALSPKAFDLLAMLVQNSGHLVEKDELLRAVWADSFVEEGNISRNIHVLRKVLGDGENGTKFIETVATKGYRFVANVTEEVEPVPKADEIDTHVYPAVDFPDTIQRNDQAKTEIRRPILASPPAKRVSPRYLLFGLGFLTAVGLITVLSFNLRSDPSVGIGGAKSMAVLPPRPADPSKRSEILEVGIADSLINRLSSSKGLLVRPLSATRKYDAVDQDALAAGRELKADHVLASTYQVVDGKIRITAQLINVANGSVEDTYPVEAAADDIFALHDTVNDAIAKKLIARFDRTSVDHIAKRGTDNEEAYRLYLHGKNLTMIVNRDYRQKANEYFEQAIKLDPNFALAYVQLARGSRAEEGRNSELIDKALELDPNLADAYVARAETRLLNDWDFVATEQNLAKAFELQPNLAEAYWLSALLAAYRGLFDDALAKIEVARTIDPSAIKYMYHRGRILYYARRYDEAIAQYQQAMDLDDRHMQPYAWMSRLYETKGDYERAYQLFLGREERSPRKDRIEVYKKAYETGGWMGVKYAGSGSTFFDKARLHAIQNEKDAAFDNLNKAVAERRDFMVTTLNVEPALDNLRDDPRFGELQKRLAF